MGVVTDEPPQLVSGGCYSLGSSRSAELLRGNAAADADVVDQLAQAAKGEFGEDGIGMGVRGHGG